jgi:hypothetical protein
VSKFAPRREDGLFAYVRSSSSWGCTSDYIVWAESLAAAKRAWGWTRQLHTSVSVRRATTDEVAALQDYA